MKSAPLDVNLHFGPIRQGFQQQVQEYDLSQLETHVTELKDRYPTHPYCVPEAEYNSFYRSFRNFANAATESYISIRLNSSQCITQRIFAKAFEIKNKHPNSETAVLMRSILRFWMTARMNEGGWMLHTNASSVEITDSWYLDRQLFQALNLTLGELSETIMKGLKTLYYSNNKHDWMAKFLASYILLNSWEMLMRQQRDMAYERGLNQRFSNLTLLDGILSSVHAILSEYRYSSGYDSRFKVGWDNGGHTINGFNEKDKVFLHTIASEIIPQRECIQQAVTNQYWDEEFSLTGFLFDPTMEFK